MVTEAEAKERHEMAMRAIGFARQLLAGNRDAFEALIKSRRYMDDVGGLIDPTLYRRVLHSDSLKQQLRMARAALAFLDEIDAVAAALEQARAAS